MLKNKKRNRISIDIASPVIIMPFKRNNDINSECWIFNTGNLSVRNEEHKEREGLYQKE